MKVTVTKDYIRIFDAYQFSKVDFNVCFNYIDDNYDTDVFEFRSRKSLKYEWALHNLGYKLGLIYDGDITFDSTIPKLLNVWFKVAGFLAIHLIN